MNLQGFKKYKINNDMESDHIALVDNNKNELELFWWSHEVIVSATNCDSFKFSKEDNQVLFDFLSKLGKKIKVKNENVGGKFVENNRFTWHSMSRAWNRPFADEAGFIAELNDDSVDISFIPAVDKVQKADMRKDFFISMGGPDGYTEPYQSISNLFAITLNKLLAVISVNLATSENNDLDMTK